MADVEDGLEAHGEVRLLILDPVVELVRGQRPCLEREGLHADERACVQLDVRIDNHGLDIAGVDIRAVDVRIGGCPACGSPLERLVDTGGGDHLAADPVDTFLADEVGGELGTELGGCILEGHALEVGVVVVYVVGEDGPGVFAFEYGAGMDAGVKVKDAFACAVAVVVVEEYVLHQAGVADGGVMLRIGISNVGGGVDSKVLGQVDAEGEAVRGVASLIEADDGGRGEASKVESLGLHEDLIAGAERPEIEEILEINAIFDLDGVLLGPALAAEKSGEVGNGLRGHGGNRCQQGRRAE